MMTKKQKQNTEAKAALQDKIAGEVAYLSILRHGATTLGRSGSTASPEQAMSKIQAEEDRIADLRAEYEALAG